MYTKKDREGFTFVIGACVAILSLVGTVLWATGWLGSVLLPAVTSEGRTVTLLIWPLWLLALAALSADQETQHDTRRVAIIGIGLVGLFFAIDWIEGTYQGERASFFDFLATLASVKGWAEPAPRTSTN